MKPGGSPFGETSQLPSAPLVATRQNGEAASHCRSISSREVRSLAAAAGVGAPSSAAQLRLGRDLVARPQSCRARPLPGSKASIVVVTTAPYARCGTTSLIQSAADQVRGSVTPRTVIGPLVDTRTISVVDQRAGADAGGPRQPQQTAARPMPDARPVSAPRPSTRFARVSPWPGTVTWASPASFSTVRWGVELAGRPRTAMSR